MAKPKTKFFCTECGYESPKWFGKCPGCQEWNSMVEETESVVKTQGMNAPIFQSKEKAQSIINIESDKEPRILTGIGELNRVLGGGIVPGSLVLVGGDPGIGKSTLLLQTSHALTTQGLRVLYISGKNPCGRRSCGLTASERSLQNCTFYVRRTWRALRKQLSRFNLNFWSLTRFRLYLCRK